MFAAVDKNHIKELLHLSSFQEHLFTSVWWQCCRLAIHSAWRSTSVCLWTYYHVLGWIVIVVVVPSPLFSHMFFLGVAHREPGGGVPQHALGQGSEGSQSCSGGISSSHWPSLCSHQWIRIHRIHVFLGLQDPDSLVRGMDPDPDPSIIMQK